MSSIGDIVLTSPVVRCLKKQLDNVEIHFVIKQQFAHVMEHNPYIDQLHIFNDNLPQLIHTFKAQQFDYIIDLHNNIRSMRIKKALNEVTAHSFYKANIQKWLFTNLKLDFLPQEHCVDRYMKTVEPLGVKNDNEGLDYFIPEKDEVDVFSYFSWLNYPFVAYGFGGTYTTKRMPNEKIKALCEALPYPIVLLGGPEDSDNADEIAEGLEGKVYHACGKLSLNQSVSIANQSNCVIAHDTGLMHIAAALQKPTVSIWGCTHPRLGMTPYMSEEKYTIIENKKLRCRPCSKLGYDTCPKKHFRCMNDLSISEIVEAVESMVSL